MADIANEYLVKRGSQDFATIASLFEGVRVLKIDGFTSVGKPINIYTAQWVNAQGEDYMVTSQETIDNVEYDVVFRENVDLAITFIVGDRYALPNHVIDVRQRHDSFIAYMTDGELYVRSDYAGRTMRCVCLKEYKPTTEKLHRPRGNNYIMGTITLHTLDVRAGDDDGYVANPYRQASGGDTPSPTPTSTIYTDNVYDRGLTAYQSELNSVFIQHTKVHLQVVGTTLMITTQ